MIRSYMPEQHRLYYAGLQLIYVSIRDGEGRPRALTLTGPLGFVGSPSPTQLTISPHQTLDAGKRQIPSIDCMHCILRPSDCMRLCINMSTVLCHADLAAGKTIGLLGLEMHTRRRNRANGVIMQAENNCLHIRVLESLGNCPKYIQVAFLAQSSTCTACLLAIVAWPVKSEECSLLSSSQCLSCKQGRLCPGTFPYCRQGCCRFCQQKHRQCSLPRGMQSALVLGALARSRQL